MGVQPYGQGTAASAELVAAHDAVVAARAAVDQLSELRRQLASLNDQRERLEAQLGRQSESADDAQLNRLLAELNALERARAECSAAIGERADAGSRYAAALAHKLDQLRAAGRAIVAEIDGLDAEVATARAYVARFDEAAGYGEQAQQSLAVLDAALSNAKDWSIRELFVPHPLDLALHIPERAAIRQAQDHQASVLRALRSLEEKLEGLLDDAPPILDLRDVRLAYEQTALVFAGLENRGRLSLDAELWRWVERARNAQPALSGLLRALLVHRESAQRALDERSAQRAQLILNA